jgi:hypothetical protein
MRMLPARMLKAKTYRTRCCECVIPSHSELAYATLQKSETRAYRCGPFARAACVFAVVKPDAARQIRRPDQRCQRCIFGTKEHPPSRPVVTPGRRESLYLLIDVAKRVA